MTTTVILPDWIESELLKASENPLETAGVLIASFAQFADGSIKLLAREMNWVPDSAYSRREALALTIQSDGYIHALARAAQIKAVALWVHTHPGNDALPVPSIHDREVDRKLRDVFQVRTETDFYGTLIFSNHSGRLAFTGEMALADNSATKIDRLITVGDRIRLINSYDSELHPIEQIFDRNVRAFGGAVQQTLSQLKIGVVGAGGTGSSVAEQLVRLGVRHFTLIDPDILSASNTTRVYGSTLEAVGSKKVDVLSKHLERIAPGVFCEVVASMITVEDTARRLAECDIVFGCTDDNAGRLVLSRLATFFLIPVFDCGIIITSSDDAEITGINGRITIMTPGNACLVCRGRVDLARASAELLTPEERNRLANEGYAPQLGGTEPAVVTFTTMVGASAVSELLEKLTGFGPSPRPSEVLLRLHDREISTNVQKPNAGHYCDPAAGKYGLGFTSPFLGQVWAA